MNQIGEEEESSASPADELPKNVDVTRGSFKLA